MYIDFLFVLCYNAWHQADGFKPFFFILPWHCAGAFFFVGDVMQKQCAKLLRAKLARNDEFYTQYADVESECDHYRSHFLNKCIYCNCDTVDSAFVKYFTKLKSQGLIRDVWFSGGLGGTDFRSPQAIELLQRADLIITNPPFSLFRDFMDLLIEYQKPFLVIGNKNAICPGIRLISCRLVYRCSLDRNLLNGLAVSSADTILEQPHH